MPSRDLTVAATLWHGTDLPSYSADRYSLDDAVTLFRNFERYLGDRIRFLLYCDAEFYAEAAKRRLPEGFFTKKIMDHHVGGWSNVFEAFTPPMRGGDRTVLVGLDTVVVGDPTWLWEWDASPVGLPLDPYHPETVCDAVISFDGDGAVLVNCAYSRAIRDGYMQGKYAMGRNPSEMLLLRDLWAKEGWASYDETGDGGKLLSYKRHVKDQGRSLDDATIVYFHGVPKVDDLEASDPVRQIWEAFR